MCMIHIQVTFAPPPFQQVSLRFVLRGRAVSLKEGSGYFETKDFGFWNVIIQAKSQNFCASFVVSREL